MITIISATNRKNSETLNFARHFQTIVQSKTTKPVQLIELENISHDWFHPNMYEEAQQTKSLQKIQDESMIPAEKFIFIMSEYNGSFPGVLKLFIDAISIRAYRPTFFGKKAALVGIASGRAGNLRGMTHFTSILNHVGTVVFPNQLPISGIEDMLDEDGVIINEATKDAIEQQVDAFLVF